MYVYQKIGKNIDVCVLTVLLWFNWLTLGLNYFFIYCTCYRDLAVDLLKLIPSSELLLAMLCARCAASMAEINDLHSRVNKMNFVIHTQFTSLWFFGPTGLQYWWAVLITLCFLSVLYYNTMWNFLKCNSYSFGYIAFKLHQNIFYYVKIAFTRIDSSGVYF